MSLIHSFVSYIHKVFLFGDLLAGLQDNRSEPEIIIDDVVKGLIYGSAFRIKAVSEIERECDCGSLKKRVGFISDDSFGYALNALDISSLRAGWDIMTKKMKRNGMIRNSPFKDWIVGVFDGIETLNSYSRCCENCCEREVSFKDGSVKTQYYHRVVVLSLIGYRFPIPIGLEMMKKEEGEVECALRLLKRVTENLGVRFIDMVIGDALYCTPRYFETCQQLGVEAGAVLKSNQAELLREAELWKNKSKPAFIQNRVKEKLKLWDLKNILWLTADKDVRVIWAERNSLKTEQRAKEKHKQWEQKRNVFAFSIGATEQLDEKTLFRIGRRRWDIDASLFMDMTVNSSLKHPTLHFDNAYENLLTIRLISFFLGMFFFHRHILPRRKNKNMPIVYLAKQLYVSASLNLFDPG